MKMYLPYLRGRQNELLCLRELLNVGKLSKKVIPIIEPVKFSSTFFSTLSKFIEVNHPVIVVENPKVGSFRDELVEMENKIQEEADEKKKQAEFQKQQNRIASLQKMSSYTTQGQNQNVAYA